MTKNKYSKKTSLQRDISKLKKEKEKVLKLRKQLIARKKEVEEIRALKKELTYLSRVGTKRRVAGQVVKKIGSDAGMVGIRGLKAIGKFSKNYLENVAREQDIERARARIKQGVEKKK